VGLQALAGAIAGYLEWRSQIEAQFEKMTTEDESWAVRARACEALRQLRLAVEVVPPVVSSMEALPASLQDHDWQAVLVKLYERKGDERLVLAEGDPRRYRDLAVAVSTSAPGLSEDKDSL
jgi:phycocyanobilin lyase subunit beta